MGMLHATDVERIEDLLRRAGLPTDAPDLGCDRYLELMGHDKKVESGRLRLILLKSLGKAIVTDDFPKEDLRAVLAGARMHA
jgi:3-dehydroquinate synthase